MRLAALIALTVDGMGRGGVTGLSVRLHDTTSGLAVGIGLFKGLFEPGGPDRTQDAERVLAILKDVLIRLRQLSGAVANPDSHSVRRLDLRASVIREAKHLSVSLEFEVTGDAGRLPPNQAELIDLVSREALRNVRRHSGASACRINLDVSRCPFVWRARDWGAGLQAASRASNGLALIQRLAAEMGCELSISSQPGLGTELVLAGPKCANQLARSEVADETA